MLAREYKLVNVTNFMDLMKNCCFATSNLRKEQPRISDKPLAVSCPSYKE